MYAVRVEKLNKTYYGKNIILNDIDLEMEAGGFTVLLGHQAAVNQLYYV